MFLRTRPLRFGIALTACLALAACSTDTDTTADPAADEAVQVESALDQNNGGLDTLDETVAFGDPMVQATPELVSFSDSTDLTPPANPPPDLTRLRVMLLWGNLPSVADQQATTPPDAKPISWNGKISLDLGAMKVHKTLKFDANDGVAPREKPNEVSFKSTTLPHVDGLLIELIAPSSGSLHFSTDALSADIAIKDLMPTGHGAALVGVGDNGLAVAGNVPTESGSADGMLIRHWKNIVNNVGRFRGRVVSGEGDMLGHIKGIYGHAKKVNKNVFFGKYIDTEGKFKGLFGGGYGMGAFQGQWATHDPGNEGMLDGLYYPGHQGGDGDGFFIGRWMDKCAD